MAAVAIFLATASLLPDSAKWYTSPVAIALWSALAVCAAAVIVRCRLWRRPAVFALHCSFALILAGALVTHVSGDSDRMHLSVGESSVIDGHNIRLSAFNIEYYPGTAAPSDFVATIIVDNSDSLRVSMNKPGHTGACRLFLSSCDADRGGCTFTVASDSAGTTVSYCGYGLLLLSMLGCSIPRRHISRGTIATTMILTAAQVQAAQPAPTALPRQLADEFGNLYVYHNERVAPLSTLARDFSLKIYGTTSYRGLSSEQVLTGWLFFYDSWKADPGIKIKDADTRRRMRLEGRRARLTDFFNNEGYLFDDATHAEANEKFALVSSAATGSLWRIFPYRADSIGSMGAVNWHSPVDDLPAGMPMEQWRMTRHSLGYIAELIAHRNWEEAAATVRKIGRYQSSVCPAQLPGAIRCNAERIFLALSSSILPAATLLILGMALLIWPRPQLARILLVVGLLWVTLLTALNWYASQHLPMANGYETMQWMAISALAACLIAGRRTPAMLPAGAIVAALALAVAMMGQRTPQLTNLMPVLRSPLLSIHVLTVMLAYALLAIIALASAMCLCGRRTLLPVARRMLRPAIFLLAAGIFIGAVWANHSWGRYWGWDPKEVWALITMIVYSFPLHTASLPMFRRDRTFAIWTLASFATVLMTYIGVNFFLGGMHSYA